MGNFYTNYTLRGPTQQAVATALAGRSAIVSPEENGCVVVFDEQSDKQDQEVITELASRLSGFFRCPLLAVLNHDDSILWYQLYLNGELMDEYDSAPGYFEQSEDAEISPPSGGDAQKLCTAFGVTGSSELERILKTPDFDDEGYVFAFERHADLASALGIPSIAAGVNYEQFDMGDLPEDLDESRIIKTKDLSASESSLSFNSWRPAPIPGYYKVSVRANPKLKKSIPIGWMPKLWADLECVEQELSAEFHRATSPYREKFKLLGFSEIGFKKIKETLRERACENGGINYVDSSRRHFGQLLYGRNYHRSTDKEVEHIIVSFTAVLNDGVFSCTNNTNPAAEAAPNHQVLRLQSHDVVAVYERFQEHLCQHADPPLFFPDLRSIQAWFDSERLKLLEDRVSRGVWVRMSDYQVALAQRKPKEPQ